MQNSKKDSRSGGRGFTLIELLIVVAIIAILAAIALPNFLEAQARAKVARNKSDMRTLVVAIEAYRVDWNDVLRDQNDSDTPDDQYGLTFSSENPGVTSDLRFIWTDGTGMGCQRFYTYRQWRPLTTPVAYLTFRPTDSFSKVVPFGLDTREINVNRAARKTAEIVYWCVLCSGPDKDNGDWFRSNNPETVSPQFPRGMAIMYDPTNGTVSNGDLWRGQALLSTQMFKEEYPYEM